MGKFETVSEIHTIRATRENNNPAAAAGESLIAADVWAEAVVTNFKEDCVPGQNTYLRSYLVEPREGNEARFDAALAGLGYKLASQTYRVFVIVPALGSEGK